MRRGLILLSFAIILFSCKKEGKKQTAEEYIKDHKSQKIEVEYVVKTMTTYEATYNKFGGCDENGALIFVSITESLTGDYLVKFESVKSDTPIRYQVFTNSGVGDNNLISINIDGANKVYRPNYSAVYNFAYTDY